MLISAPLAILSLPASSGWLILPVVLRSSIRSTASRINKFFRPAERKKRFRSKSGIMTSCFLQTHAHLKQPGHNPDRQKTPCVSFSQHFSVTVEAVLPQIFRLRALLLFLFFLILLLFVVSVLLLSICIIINYTIDKVSFLLMAQSLLY